VGKLKQEFPFTIRNSNSLQFNNRVDTRGNKYKLLNKSFHYDLRKYSFTARTINTWNSLPNKIVDAESVNYGSREPPLHYTIVIDLDNLSGRLDDLSRLIIRPDKLSRSITIVCAVAVPGFRS